MKRTALKTIFTTLLCVGALTTPALAQLNGGFELCMGQSPQRYDGNRDQRRPDRPGHHWQEGRWERHGQNNHDGPDRWTPGRWEPDHKDNNRREEPRKDAHTRDGEGDERQHDSRRGNDRG
ncbi:MAG: hypothetical protein AB9900_08120 [Humidesulfovibrio sp.]